MPPIKRLTSDTNGPPVISPEQIADDLAELTRLKTESRRVAGKISNVMKNHERAGGDKRALMRLHDDLKLDTAEARSKLKAQVRYAAIHGIADWVSNAKQTGLDLGGEVRAATGAPADRLSAVWAYNDGFNSGRSGETIDSNKHKPGTEAHVKWRDGWADGQGEMPDKAAPKQASSRRKRTPSTADIIDATAAALDDNAIH